MSELRQNDQTKILTDPPWAITAVKDIGWEGVSHIARIFPPIDDRVVRRNWVSKNEMPPNIETWLRKLWAGHLAIPLPPREVWTRDPDPPLEYTNFSRAMTALVWKMTDFMRAFGATKEEYEHFSRRGAKMSRLIIEPLEQLRILHESNRPPLDWHGTDDPGGHEQAQAALAAARQLTATRQPAPTPQSDRHHEIANEIRDMLVEFRISPTDLATALSAPPDLVAPWMTMDGSQMAPPFVLRWLRRLLAIWREANITPTEMPSGARLFGKESQINAAIALASRIDPNPARIAVWATFSQKWVVAMRARPVVS